MKRMALIAVCLLVSASIACAAAIDTKAGTKALMFQFSGLSNLGVGAYQGGFGMRYFFQDDMAIRPGIQVGVSSGKNKAVDPEGKMTDTNFGVNLAIEKHMAGAPSVSPYIGAQAGFNFGKDKSEQGTDEQTITNTGFGIAALLGFQWGFTESLTLGGEYTLGVNISKHEKEVTSGSTTTTTEDTSSTRLGIGTASLFLSVAI